MGPSRKLYQRYRQVIQARGNTVFSLGPQSRRNKVHALVGGGEGGRASRLRGVGPGRGRVGPGRAGSGGGRGGASVENEG